MVFPAMLLAALVGTSYAYYQGLTDLFIVGLMASSQIVLMFGTLHLLMRAMGAGRPGFHPACYELYRLDCECAGIEQLRREVEEKREDANLLLARLVGREPGLGRAFTGRPGEGHSLEGESMALDARIEVLRRQHRRLDLAEAALAAGDVNGAAEQYEALGLLQRADEMRDARAAEPGAARIVLRARQGR